MIVFIYETIYFGHFLTPMIKCHKNTCLYVSIMLALEHWSIKIKLCSYIFLLSKNNMMCENSNNECK